MIWVRINSGSYLEAIDEQARRAVYGGDPNAPESRSNSSMLGPMSSGRSLSATPTTARSDSVLSRLPPRPPSMGNFANTTRSGFSRGPPRPMTAQSAGSAGDEGRSPSRSGGVLRSARMADPRIRPKPERPSTAAPYGERSKSPVINFQRKPQTPQGRFRSVVGNHA
jgi:hypothetical protein